MEIKHSVTLPQMRFSGGDRAFALRNGTTALGRIDPDGDSGNVRVSIQDGPETYRRFTIDAEKFLAFVEAEASRRELCLVAESGKFFARPGST